LLSEDIEHQRGNQRHGYQVFGHVPDTAYGQEKVDNKLRCYKDSRAHHMPARHFLGELYTILPTAEAAGYVLR